MSISFGCSSCGKRLKAPDSAAGKTSKCPQCGKPVTCPNPVRAGSVAQEPDVPEILDDMDPYSDLDDGKPYGVSGPAEADETTVRRRPCPQCGEMIAADAEECRFCGEVFVEPVKKTAKKKKKKTFSGYAGFWARFAALVIDNLVFGLPMTVVQRMVIGAPLPPAGPGLPPTLPPNYLQNALLFNLVVVALQVAYFAGMESSSYQATLGKMALGLKVTDLSGHRISLARAIGRYFAKIISYATCLIGFIMAAFTEKKQALHDMIAGTLVVK